MGKSWAIAFSIILAAVAVHGAPEDCTCSGFSIRTDTNIPGGDIQFPCAGNEVIADIPSVEVCCKACWNAPNCYAFVYAHNVGTGQCWLKKQSGWTSTAAPGYTTGIHSAADYTRKLAFHAQKIK